MAGEAKQDPMVQALMDRGLRAYGGNSRLMDFQAPSKGIVASEAAPATLAEAVARLKSGQPGGAMNAAPVAPVAPTTPEQAAAQAAPSIDGDFDPTALLGVGGAGAAGYAIYRALRGRGAKTPNPVADPGFGAPKNGQLSGGKGAAHAIAGNKQKRLAAPDTIIDGEWSEVPKSIADQRQPAQLEQHGMPATRQEMAKRKLRNAAEGTRNSEAVRVKGTVKEPLDAGLDRVLGIPAATAKTIRSNPGLAEILARRIAH